MHTKGLTMEKILNQVDRITYSVNVNQLSSPASPMLAQENHEEGSLGHG